MPSVGPSPSGALSKEPSEDKDDDDDDAILENEYENGLRSRLNLPHGVTGAESCRSASPGDVMTDSYRGESCGSFEFLSKSNKRGNRHTVTTEDESEADDEDQRLFFPQRNEEREAILRQIQTLSENVGETTEESRESSAHPEGPEVRPVESQVLEEIQKSIKPPSLIMEKPQRNIPLVIAVADAARNPSRMRGKPSRLRDLQQSVPMEENPVEEQK